MIHFERSFDYELIRAIMIQPAIWRHISDDFSLPAAEYRPVESDAVWYVVVWEANDLLGLWMFHPHNGICWEVHTCLLPHAWGERAHRAALAMAEWIWHNTPCRRLITNVPADNRLAFQFALSAGMEPYGKNEDSFQKGGKLVDQICLGISRPQGMPLFEAGKAATEPAERPEEEIICQPQQP